MIKMLREMDIEEEKGESIPWSAFKKELKEDEAKEDATLIESKIGMKKVFFSKGCHGSLVPDIANDRLLGKIEGIKEIITYERKTIKACEKKFRKAVSRLKGN